MNPLMGPLTYGQVSVLRSMEGLSWERQADANIVNVWRLYGQHSYEEICGVWSALTAANQSLRSRYFLTGQSSSQIVDPPCAASLMSLEVGETEASVTEVADEWAAHPLELSQQPWRAFIATHHGQPKYLATVIHHVVTDGTAAALLKEQFYRALAGEPLTGIPQPLDLATAQQSDNRGLARKIAYWNRVWPDLQAADRVGAADTSQRIGADLFSAAALSAARAVAERHGVSLQSVILAMAAIALSRMNGRTRLTFGLMAANRFDPGWAAIVSSMNQLAPLTVAPEPGRGAIEFLSDVFSRGLEAYRNGCYDLDRLKVFLMREGHANPDPIAFDVYYNFVGEVPDAPADGDLVTTSVAWTAYNRFSGSRLSISAGVSTGIVLNARASQLYLPGDGPGRLLCAMEAGLLDLAANEPARIGDIQLDPRRAIEFLPELGNVAGNVH